MYQVRSMKFQYIAKAFFVSVLITTATSSIAQNQSVISSPKSDWVYLNNQGKLSYKALPKGDRIMDFSYSGYKGGGVAIPSPEVKIVLSPVAGDNSDLIQNAINEVSKLKPENGFRGAVLLKPGTYN